VCRTLNIPNSKFWLGIFNSALLDTVSQWEYEQVHPTDLTIEETIAVCQAIIDEFWSSELGCPFPCVQPDGLPFMRLGASGNFEQLVNGEWVSPEGDYALPPTPARTEPTASERRCLAAANATNVLKILYEVVSDEVSADADEAEVTLALLVAIAALLGLPFGAVSTGIIGLIYIALKLFIEMAQYLTADLWDDDFTKELQCVLYACATDTAGVVTFDYNCVHESLAASVDLFDLDALTQLRLFGQVAFMLNVIGGDGLNAAGATTAITEAGCDCGVCAFPSGHYLGSVYQFENLVVSPSGSVGSGGGRIYREYGNVTPVTIRVQLPVVECFDAIRFTMFRYNVGSGATTGLKIRTVGGTWSADHLIATSGGSWVNLDVGVDIAATGYGYSVREFEIQVVNANGSGYLAIDNIQIWEPI